MIRSFKHDIHCVWDGLLDYEAAQADQALTYLMNSLCDLTGAWNSTWGGAVCMDGDDGGDPLQGWRVSAMKLLHPIAPQPDDGHFKEILRLWDRRELDPSFLLPLQGVGTFRSYAFRRDLPPEWFESSFYDRHYGSIGTSDAVFVAFPLNRDAESHLGFYSPNTFTDEEIELLSYAVRGIKWFHQRLMLSHGLLMATTPLTSSERKVLHLLLTEASEKQIADQLGIAVPTAHQYVVSIYRKFGVRSRAGLMSLWLNRSR